jgi:agmatine/peptidylarginine deiminase
MQKVNRLPPDILMKNKDQYEKDVSECLVNKGSRKIHITSSVLFLCVLVFFILRSPHTAEPGVSVVTSPTTQGFGVPGRTENKGLQSFQQIIQTGDWEARDVLMIVDNFEWEESIEMIVQTAYHDGMQSFILTDGEDLREDGYIARLVGSKFAKILKVPYDSPWIRDYGPLQLRTSGKGILWLDFDYKSDRPHDNYIPHEVSGFMDVLLESVDYRLDGGGIISNGRGLCAISDATLSEISLDHKDAEQMNAFRKSVGCRAIAIVPALTGESTGHIDVIAQFLSADTVAVAMINGDAFPELASELESAVAALTKEANSLGQQLIVIRVPMHVEQGVFYSYINGTRLRDTFLVPSFDTVPLETEDIAYRRLGEAMPDVTLVPIPADVMAQRGGAVHCITLTLSLPKSLSKSQFHAKRMQ